MKKNFQPSKHANVTQRFLRASIPASVDWRTQGVVNPIKNQGNCGSCSAFSALCSLESAIAIKTGQLPYLSAQNLVDCVYSEDMCLQGGWYYDSWDYIQNTNRNGINTEANYPYASHVTGLVMSSIFHTKNELFFLNILIYIILLLSGLVNANTMQLIHLIQS